MRHGKRTLSLWYSKDLRQIVEVPTGNTTTHRDAVLVILLFEKTQSEAFQPCKVVRCVAISDARFVFAKCHVQTPVKRTFDGPMASNVTCEAFDVHAN